MTTIPIFLAVLGLLVVAHELGHFAIAKLAKVKVIEFGVGYPPRLWAFTRGETTYSINLLPLGGYVRMLGEEDPEHEQSFARRSAMTRLAVLFAGPAMNVILPIFLLTIVFMMPQSVVETNVTVLEVAAGSPAADSGVLPGDIIRESGGRTMHNSGDLIQSVQRRLGAGTTWVVERGGRLHQLSLVPRFDPPEGQGATGIVLTDARVTVASVQQGSPAADAGLQRGDLFLRIANAPTIDQQASRVLRAQGAEEAAAVAFAESPNDPVAVDVLRAGTIVRLIVPPEAGELTGYTADVRPESTRSEPVWRAVTASIQQIVDILVMFRNEISKWIAGSGEVQFSGPVGIARITGEVASAGLSPLITWTALLSINLAIVNLLPIPALDGGRITFILVELARGGRRLAPSKERVVHIVGFAVLIAMIIVISVNDIQRILGGAEPFG